jgi:hypothetical protein
LNSPVKRNYSQLESFALVLRRDLDVSGCGQFSD